MTSIGDIIAFRYPTKPVTGATEPNPKLLVLHPNWEGQMHGLRLNYAYMTAQQENVLKMFMSPKFQKMHKAALTREAPLLVQEYDRIIKEGGNTQVTSPQDFYRKMIRPFISPRDFEPYRRYKVGLVSGVRVVEPYHMILNPPQYNEKIHGPVEEGTNKFDEYKKLFEGMRGSKFRKPPV